MLIPHTLAVTDLSNLKEGDVVNLEFDMMAKMITQHCKKIFDELSGGNEYATTFNINFSCVLFSFQAKLMPCLV